MGRGTPQGGRGAARNNNNNYGSNRGGGNRNNKLDVSALGLVSPLGGAGLGTLSALHQTVGVGGLGGLQQTQLGSLLGGGTALAGGVSNELAGLCALLGGSQSHDVTLNAMQVLQVQQAMAAQAATKQKEAEAVIQATIDAEVAKRTEGLVVKPSPSLASPKPKTAKTADVAPEDDGVSRGSGASKGAKRRRKHAERANEVEGLSHRLQVFEEAFEKVAQAASARKPSGYASEDDTRPHKSPDSDLRSIVLAVQRGLRKTRTAVEPKKTDDLAKKVCALLGGDDDAGTYTPAKPRRSPRRTSPASVGSMASGMPGPPSMGGSTSRRSASKALSADFGDDHAMDNMRKRIATRKAKDQEKKKQVAEGASKSQSTRGGSSKEAKKATTDDEGRKLTKLIDRALQDVPDEAEEVADPKGSDCDALRPLALKIAKVYKPCAMVVKKTELMEGLADTHGIRAKRKEDIVDWLIRVLYRLEYFEHGLLTYAGVVTLLEKHE